MTDPTPLDLTPQGLANWIGAPVDEIRAAIIIQGALNAVSIHTGNPVPPVANQIVLQVATRVYSNVQQTTMQTIGIESVQRAANGITLTDDELRDLQAITGSTGKAFSINIAPGAHAPYYDRWPYYPVDAYTFGWPYYANPD